MPDDFVITARNDAPTLVECKWRAGGFEPRNMLAFRRHYSEGANYVVTADTERSYVRDYGGVSVWFLNLPELMQRLRAG